VLCKNRFDVEDMILTTNVRRDLMVYNATYIGTAHADRITDH